MFYFSIIYLNDFNQIKINMQKKKNIQFSMRFENSDIL